MACGQPDPRTSRAEWSQADCSEITADNVDDCIRMNQIQALGTHNSYKLEPLPELIEAGNEIRPGWSENIEYGHLPIDEQLGQLGIRQVELDIFADPEGGLFSEPAGALLVGDDEFVRPQAMLEPGFKALHVQDVDYRSNCLTFIECLTQVRDWSLANPNHLPIMVLVEMKDSELENWGDLEFTAPIPIGADLLRDADREIWEVFERDHVITPDDIRGGFETLQRAMLTRGWPTLAQSRGKVFFALDNTGSHRDAYLEETPNLEGRPMFVSLEPGHSSAAFIKMNNAIDTYDRIVERVAEGYIIRTRSDIPMVEARTGDTTRVEAALTSGAQYVSTDFPDGAPYHTGFQVELPETDQPARCNPVSAPPGCRNELIRE